ncbi:MULTISPECIES: Gfo/Idh/MocA family protein [unclassified Microbispora]|uniref:Gfo/Idh/MocA family protein n=1 Tax=unclassified Microbispora TaxID=2614687 RepID=UPI0014731DE5|nr:MULTISPECIES: Gfo/Idh/MocA family oxidoreductase [unclassified Microbispora]
MGDRVRVGFVGLGITSRSHFAVLEQRPEVALEFTVDPKVTEPPAFRETTPAHYPDLDEALDAHQPDLLVIATPTRTHLDLTVRALTLSSATVLVEKPLVHDLAALARLRELDGKTDVRGRVFTAHHFAFAPEVRWAAEQIAGHPEWGPITRVTSAFYDPYVLRGEQAFASYVSSWTDSGVNQLSMLARFAEPAALTSLREMDGGASAWATCEFRSRGRTGLASLRSSWLTGESSKGTTLTLGETDVEVVIDHTANTGFAAQAGTLLAAYGHDGRTPRKTARHRPLYESLLSGAPDPVLGFDTTAKITELHHSRP